MKVGTPEPIRPNRAAASPECDTGSAVPLKSSASAALGAEYGIDVGGAGGHTLSSSKATAAPPRARMELLFGEEHVGAGGVSAATAVEVVSSSAPKGGGGDGGGGSGGGDAATMAVKGPAIGQQRQNPTHPTYPVYSSSQQQQQQQQQQQPCPQQQPPQEYPTRNDNPPTPTPPTNLLPLSRMHGLPSSPTKVTHPRSPLSKSSSAAASPMHTPADTATDKIGRAHV